MTATSKFYTGLAIAIALIVSVSYYAGYRHGFKAGFVSGKAVHAIVSKTHASP